MHGKLRKWLESRCWRQPDGRWLVHPASFRWPPPLPHILPGDAEKDAYLAQAARIGRVQLVCESIQSNVFLAFAALPFFHDAVDWRIPSLLLWASTIGLSVVALLSSWFGGRAEGGGARGSTRRVRAPLDALPLREEREPRWWPSGQRGLKRLRPGWMVAVDAAFLFGLVLVLAASSLGFGAGYECRDAMRSWWAGTAPMPDGCFGTAGWFLLLMAAVWLSVLVLTSWDWWRWNRRRERPATDPV